MLSLTILANSEVLLINLTFLFITIFLAILLENFSSPNLNIISASFFSRISVTLIFRELSFEAYSFLSIESKLPIFLKSSVIIPFLPKISVLIVS